MGRSLPADWPVLAPELATHHSVLRLPARGPKGDLHHQCHRVGKHAFRKITKNRGSFPSDEALLKLFHLALRNISQKWRMPIRDWKAALTRFTIQIEDLLNSL